MEASLKRLAQRRQTPLADLVLLRLLHHVNDRIIVELRAAMKPYGLTDWSLRTLLMLQGGSEEKVAMAELTQITGDTPTNMTRVCDALVAKGWARRSTSPTDRRKIFLELTARGEDLIDRVLPIAWGRLEWFMNRLSRRDHADLKRILLSLLTAVNEEAGQGVAASGYARKTSRPVRKKNRS